MFSVNSHEKHNYMIAFNRDINKHFILCRYSKRLVEKLTLMNKIESHKINLSKVKKALYYAKRYHGKQKRKNGEPFYVHPLEVACMVSENLFRTDIIVTAILHDTIEDTVLTKETIAQEFGNNIANKVEDLTRIKNNRKISAVEIIEILYQRRKKDLLLIKLFDRLHNMQTVEAKPPEKVRKTTLETLQVFLDLANYLEMPNVEKQLHEYCLNITSNYKNTGLHATDNLFMP